MKSKRKRAVGRPSEGRVKLTCYILPSQFNAVIRAVKPEDNERNTIGKALGAIIENNC